MSISFLFLIAVVLIMVWLIVAYNGLIRLRNRTDEAWSDIDVQLKRRYDLIPNLVNTVKGYAAHESQTFEKVIQARTSAMSASKPSERAAAESILAGALHGIVALAEAYPDLKANANFLKLQDDLTDTEDKIQAARRFYNGNVRDFNTKLQVFPFNLFGQALGFATRDFFELSDDGERKTPEVKF